MLQMCDLHLKLLDDDPTAMLTAREIALSVNVR
jgi:hypothetical protein